MRIKHITFTIFLLAFCFAGASFTATANPVIIDFDSLSDGDVVTNQFVGLTFSNALVASSGISLNEFEFPPRSGSNVIFDNGGPLSITFANPVMNVTGSFTYAVPITLSAFDSSNNFIGSVTSLFSNNLALSGDPDSSPNELISFSFASGISRITITGDVFGGSFTLDDLTINTATAVPEPTTISLFVLSFVTAAARKKFLKHSKSQP
jgi:hypothetical protein